MSQLPAPPPAIDADSEPFWSATLEGILLVNYCPACQAVVWFPRPVCPWCHTWGTAWRPAPGTGTVFSWTELHGGVNQYEGCRYYLAYVDVDDGPRMLTNLVDTADPAIGQRVEVVFEATTGPAALPRFRPVRG